jgi:hypothetical protein
MSRRRTESSYESGFQDLPPWVQLLTLLVVVGALVWAFVLQPLIEWINQNILIVGIVVLIVVILLLVVAYLWWKKIEKEVEEKKRLEETYKSQGLVKYIRQGKEIWGTPGQVKIWEGEDEKAKLVNRVAASIRTYQPPKLRKEFGYQMGLHGFLQNEFRETRVEVQKGHSRPDIVIGDIAIEVKGPTDYKALETISDKAMRYIPKNFKHLIVVLFEPQVNEGRYQEWEEGMRRTFPPVIILRMDRQK